MILFSPQDGRLRVDAYVFHLNTFPSPSGTFVNVRKRLLLVWSHAPVSRLLWSHKDHQFYALRASQALSFVSDTHAAARCPEPSQDSLPCTQTLGREAQSFIYTQQAPNDVHGPFSAFAASLRTLWLPAASSALFGARSPHLAAHVGRYKCLPFSETARNIQVTSSRTRLQSVRNCAVTATHPFLGHSEFGSLRMFRTVSEIFPPVFAPHSS